MTRMPTWFGVLAVCTLAFALSACKSRAGSSCGSACAPPVASNTCQPPVGEFDTSSTFTDTGAFPPAPSVPSDPAITQADLDHAHEQAMREAELREASQRQLRIEQERLSQKNAELEAMRERIDALERAGPLEQAPTLVQSSNADLLAQELRTQAGAEVIQDGDMVIVRVTNGFQAGSDMLRKDVRLMSALNATASALGRYPAASVAVVGHSDTDPINVTRKKWSSNDQLSLARAERVASVLASNGVESDRISIDGRGSREPLIAPERTKSDKATNRRVEIMIRL